MNALRQVVEEFGVTESCTRPTVFTVYRPSFAWQCNFVNPTCLPFSSLFAARGSTIELYREELYRLRYSLELFT